MTKRSCLVCRRQQTRLPDLTAVLAPREIPLRRSFQLVETVYVIEVILKLHDPLGHCLSEFAMAWRPIDRYPHPEGPFSPARLELYEDVWPAFIEHFSDLFELIANQRAQHPNRRLTPSEFIGLLLALDFAED